MVTWITALAKTRQAISGVLRRVFQSSDRVDEVTREELEETLLRADVSAALTREVLDQLDKGYHNLRVSRRDMLAGLLTRALPAPAFSWRRAEKPLSILIVGVNGSGKTTTSAKLAHLVRKEGLKPVLCAADTFRAAGSEQLKLWAGMVDCDVVAGATGADAAAVAYDGVEAASARGADVLIVDTAGRMHTRQPLMAELEKVRRAMGKRVARAPEETWIVLDASLGQNAIAQARLFHQSVPLTGAIVAKLDGSAKAGFVFSVTRELNIPVLFAGLGEGKDDLVAFDPETFVKALLGIGNEDQSAQR